MLKTTVKLSLFLLRENRVPVILISFRNRFLAFAPAIAGGHGVSSFAVLGLGCVLSLGCVHT
jgi:hypothetical protein